MESDIDSTVSWEPIRPNMDEFENFSEFIMDLERKGISFALVCGSTMFLWSYIQK